MQVIGFLHILFDFLAFKNDVGFWKGREDLKGLSSRGIIASAMQTLIIYLYLLDSDSINSIILMTYTVSTALELWKVAKVLALRARLARNRRSGGGGGGAATADATEERSERFDEVATRTLTVALSPLVAGWALYALVSYPHRSWYSWVVSSLADAVYLFGFISMTPQLFINYKLKSVAHMPWRVMAYKAFNTFVDDAFALMVSMPTAHRVACLRDDVVFLIFLYQRRLYPVDLTRANEYGIAYERTREQLADGGTALITDLPADALSLVLYRLPLAHQIAAAASVCSGFRDAARLALVARPYSGEVVTIPGHPRPHAPIVSVAAVADGRVITCSLDAAITGRSSVQVWRDGMLEQGIPGTKGHAMAVLPGERIVTAGDPTDTMLRLWTLDGALERSFEVDHHCGDCVAALPDAMHFVAGIRNGGGEIRLYHVDGTLVHTFHIGHAASVGHPSEVWGLAVTPDGQYIISAAGDREDEDDSAPGHSSRCGASPPGAL